MINKSSYCSNKRVNGRETERVETMCVYCANLPQGSGGQIALISFVRVCDSGVFAYMYKERERGREKERV